MQIDPSTFAAPHRTYVQQLLDADRKIDELVKGLTPEQLRWRPAPESWSIAECINHLAVTNEVYARRIDRVLQEKGRPRKSDQPYSHGIIGRMFLNILEPPAKRKVKAPAKFLPPQDDHGDVVAALHKSHEKLFELLRKHDAVDFSSIKVPSPAAKFLKFNLAAAFAILAAHDRRHTWQAENVKAEMLKR